MEISTGWLRFAQIEIDFDAHRLRVDGVPVPLEPKAFAVLALLASQPGRLIPRDEILDKVWGHAHVTPGVLNRIATLLRQALGESAHQPRWLHTVHGIGYRLDLPEDALRSAPGTPTHAVVAPSVPAAADRAPAGPSAAQTPSTGSVGVHSASGGGGRPLLAALLASALALLLVGAAVVWWYHGDTVESAQPRPGAADSPRLGAPVSVAVLPFVNTSGDASQQFFADGLSDNLIDTLSKFDGIKVIGRISSFRFRDSPEDSKAIGAKLGASYLISGNVHHVGDAVRIGLELSSTADGHAVWAEHYDRPYKDLFALQDEITHAVAVVLQAKLQVPGATPLQTDRPPGGSVEAYSAYLQGWKYWHDENFAEAARYLSRAVEIDPRYAMAWAHLSGAWSTVARFSNEPPEQAAEHRRIARVAADKALQLAPQLGPAHAARAFLAFYELDFLHAVSDCRRAVELAPNDSMVLNGCSFNLTGAGKLTEAIALRDRLRSIEPLYAVNNFEYANLLRMTGQLERAEQYLRAAETVSSSFPLDHLKLALLRGDASAAQAIAAQAPANDRTLFETLAAQIGPDRTVADRWLADLLADKAWLARRDSGRGYDSPFIVARIQALRGNLEQTLIWLERSLDRNPSRVLFLLDDPFLLRFRDEPRFIAFCSKLGLPSPSESEALSIDQIRAQLGSKNGS